MRKPWLVLTTILLGWQFMVYNPYYRSPRFDVSSPAETREECEKLRAWALDRLRARFSGSGGLNEQYFNREEAQLVSWCVYSREGK